ncbi:hypothetical protein TWF718_009959 [Orbilia javanica]|uniref:Clr5 domain-containing protein n=1 Tax=Orbilia javanica TaxID=47235 RepID=A0AAN8MUM4_9PEZI
MTSRQQVKKCQAAKISLETWEYHKGDISRLYLEERKTLEEVRVAMELNVGFTATKSQYIRMVNEVWRLKKNLKGDDVQCIESREKKRAQDGKRTGVKVGTRVLDEIELRRKRRRHMNNVSVFEKFQRRFMEESDNYEAESRTPEGMQIFTPSPSPSLSPLPISPGTLAPIELSPLELLRQSNHRRATNLQPSWSSIRLGIPLNAPVSINFAANSGPLQHLPRSLTTCFAFSDIALAPSTITPIASIDIQLPHSALPPELAGFHHTPPARERTVLKTFRTSDYSDIDSLVSELIRLLLDSLPDVIEGPGLDLGLEPKDIFPEPVILPIAFVETLYQSAFEIIERQRNILNS